MSLLKNLFGLTPTHQEEFRSGLENITGLPWTIKRFRPYAVKMSSLEEAEMVAAALNKVMYGNDEVFTTDVRLEPPNSYLTIRDMYYVNRNTILGTATSAKIREAVNTAKEQCHNFKEGTLQNFMRRTF